MVDNAPDQNDHPITGARRDVLLKAIETIGAIEGCTDGDNACIRCAQRMIAEVLGLPLGPFRLLAEDGQQSLLYMPPQD